MHEPEIIDLVPDTAVQVPEPPVPENKIYVSYLYGKKGRHTSRLIKTTFPEVETEEQLSQIVGYLAKEHGDPQISILFLLPLEE